MSALKLAGRTAVITGAARGQGEATARLFAAEGANVILTDMLADAGSAVAQSIGPSAMFMPLDVTSDGDWATLVRQLEGRGVVPDILVNNAGVTHVASTLDLERADFERVLGINLIGPWLGMKALVPGMLTLGKGAVVNISSIAGMSGMNGVAAYSASKWGLRGLSRTAAMELGHRGVRVNLVLPGSINTKMVDLPGQAASDTANFFLDQPIGRIGEPDEVARVSLFLASDDSSYICGGEIVVDGGHTLGAYTDVLPGAPDK